MHCAFELAAGRNTSGYREFGFCCKKRHRDGNCTTGWIWLTWKKWFLQTMYAIKLFWTIATLMCFFTSLAHQKTSLVFILGCCLLRAVHIQTWFVIGFSCVHCIFLFLRDVLFMLFFFWCAVSEVGGEARVSKLVTRMYGEAPQLSRK